MDTQWVDGWAGMMVSCSAGLLGRGLDRMSVAWMDSWMAWSWVIAKAATRADMMD